MKEVRSRFAPSPTGYMHIGNLRAVLFEYLVAKSQGGKFILRIEDTDQKRKVEGAVDFIYNTLSLCGFEIDEGPKQGGNYGPYIQSERIDLYKKYAEQLVKEGKAYYCFCTPEELEKEREKAEARKEAFLYPKTCLDLDKSKVEENIKKGLPFVIRQNVPRKGISSYEDEVYGKIEVENRFIEDQILLKSDGYPTYNFANVVDDHLMKINYVVRGNEYLSTTPKYNLLYDAFGWERPNYIHLPHVNGADGKKLSKRNGDSSFMDLYDRGYIPEGIINYLALLGWSSKDNKEIFSMDELISDFDVKRLNKSGAIFDIKKLNWVNSHYIKKLSNEDLFSITINHLEEAYDLSCKNKSWLESLVLLYKDEISFGAEIVEVSKIFFEDELELNDECIEFLNQDGVDKTLEVFRKEIDGIENWSVEAIEAAINQTKDIAEVKGKMLYMPIRIKVSGHMHGPELPATIYLLGKEKVLNNLK